jgi:hypothetical protein
MSLDPLPHIFEFPKKTANLKRSLFIDEKTTKNASKGHRRQV